MNLSRAKSLKNPEAGGVTIMVVLSMLVLMSVAAFGMSRNAIRESIITGTARQGVEVRNVGDSGINWAIYWLYAGISANTSSEPGAAALQTQVNTLLTTPELAGLPQAINRGTDNTDLDLYSVTGDQQYYNLTIMRMDKLPVKYTSQNAIASNTVSENLYPDLWAIRSTGHYIQGSIDFQHSKESWVSTPARGVVE